MARRPSALLLLALFGGVAHAWYAESGNPNGVIQRPRIQVNGQLSSFKLTDRHGRVTPVNLQRSLDLGAAIPLPPGDWVELTLVLDGPATVALAGARPAPLSASELTVVIQDPDASRVILDWTLPEGALQALQAGVTPRDLPQLLNDGALAMPAP